MSATSLAQAQDDLDWFCATTGDRRPRGDVTAAVMAEREGLLELPATAYPAVTEETRKVAANGLVAVEGNHYSVPPEFVGTEVTVRRRLGTPSLEMVSTAGRVVATHQAVPRGRGRVIRPRAHLCVGERGAGLVHF